MEVPSCFLTPVRIHDDDQSAGRADGLEGLHSDGGNGGAGNGGGGFGGDSGGNGRRRTTTGTSLTTTKPIYVIDSDPSEKRS
jgi:hypothetical protein